MSSFQDVRKQTDKTIEDLRSHGYFNEFTPWFKMKEMNLQERSNFVQNLILNNITDKLVSKYGKTWFKKSSQKVTFLTTRPRKAGKSYDEYTCDIADDPFKFATDNLFTIQRGFYMMQNAFFYGAIRTTLQRLFESGIFQMIQKTCDDEFSDLPGIKGHQKQTEYSTLTWDQLYPGFYVWVAALVACIVAFMGEIIVFKVKNKNIPLRHK